jgi:hypothetical protein
MAKRGNNGKGGTFDENGFYHAPCHRGYPLPNVSPANNRADELVRILAMVGKR